MNLLRSLLQLCRHNGLLMKRLESRATLAQDRSEAALIRADRAISALKAELELARK